MIRSSSFRSVLAILTPYYLSASFQTIFMEIFVLYFHYGFMYHDSFLSLSFRSSLLMSIKNPYILASIKNSNIRAIESNKNNNVPVMILSFLLAFLPIFSLLSENLYTIVSLLSEKDIYQVTACIFCAPLASGLTTIHSFSLFHHPIPLRSRFLIAPTPFCFFSAHTSILDMIPNGAIPRRFSSASASEKRNIGLILIQPHSSSLCFFSQVFQCCGGILDHGFDCGDGDPAIGRTVRELREKVVFIYQHLSSLYSFAYTMNAISLAKSSHDMVT